MFKLNYFLYIVRGNISENQESIYFTFRIKIKRNQTSKIPIKQWHELKWSFTPLFGHPKVGF